MSSQEDKYRELHAKIELQLHNLVPQNMVMPISQMIWRLMEEDFSHLSQLSDENEVEFKRVTEGMHPHFDVWMFKRIGYAVFMYYFSQYLYVELKEFSEKEDVDTNEIFSGFIFFLGRCHIVFPGTYSMTFRGISFTHYSLNQEQAFANVIRVTIRSVMGYAEKNIENLNGELVKKDIEVKLNKVYAYIYPYITDGTDIHFVKRISLDFPGEIIDFKKYASRESDDAYLGSLICMLAYANCLIACHKL